MMHPATKPSVVETSLVRRSAEFLRKTSKAFCIGRKAIPTRGRFPNLDQHLLCDIGVDPARASRRTRYETARGPLGASGW